MLGKRLIDREGVPGSQAPTILCSEEWPGFWVKWKCAGWCLAVVEGSCCGGDEFEKSSRARGL